MAKKQVSKQVGKGSSFYVGLANATDVRKTMLETSRELLMSLKQYEHLRSIRSQKSELYTKYTAQISTVKSLMLKLQRAVPKHDMSDLVIKQKVVAMAPPDETISEQISVPVQKTERMPKGSIAAIDEVTRLEAELAAIEAKLSNM